MRPLIGGKLNQLDDDMRNVTDEKYKLREGVLFETEIANERLLLHNLNDTIQNAMYLLPHSNDVNTQEAVRV